MLRRPPASVCFRDSIVPTHSTIPVNIAQVSFHSEIRPEAIEAKIIDRRHSLEKTCSVIPSALGNWHVAPPGEFRRVEEKQFVNDASFERRSVELAARLQQHAQDFASAQLC